MNEDFQWPNDEFRHAGWSLISQFQNELSAALENILSPLYGPDWFQDCVNKDKWAGKIPEKEIYVILKETVQYANQNFRMAIAKRMLSQESLTKPEIESLDKILDYRNLWSHEPSERSKRVTQSQLRDLALNIKKFATSESLIASCTNVIEADDLADLIFSLPVVARHLPENAKNKEQIARIAEVLLRDSQDNDFDVVSGVREKELVEALQATLHAWQKTDLRFDFLLIRYRLLQLQVLNKVNTDSNSLAISGYQDKSFNIAFPDEETTFSLSDGLSELTHGIRGAIAETLREILPDIEKSKIELEKFTEVPEADKCKCEYCQIVPTILSPFEDKDRELNEFMEANIFAKDAGVRFVKLVAASDEKS
jgi:hypothetical protein